MAEGDPSPAASRAAGADSTSPENEALWRGILLGTDSRYRDGRAIFVRLPGNPRCYMCSAPFKGPGAVVARRMGRKPWPKNPHYCSACFDMIENAHGGAEVDCTLLFADVRGSTSLAETMRPAEFRRLLDRFYFVAAEVLHEHDAILDKFVGDEAVAIFIPALSGERHAARAVMAGRALLRVTGHGDADGPWLPIGIGVHTGIAFVGAVGEGPSSSVTALGDTVNVAARLASAAGPGELLASAEAANAADIDLGDAERRDLELKGKSERVPGRRARRSARSQRLGLSAIRSGLNGSGKAGAVVWVPALCL
jgi:adenylate cyclase